MSLVEAQHLLADIEYVGAVWIGNCRGDVAAIVNCVDRRGCVLGSQCQIEAGGSEILADRLKRAAEDLGDSVEVRGIRGRCGPEVQKRLYAGCSYGARS